MDTPAAQALVDRPSEQPGWSELHPDDELIDVAFVPDGSRLRLVRNGSEYVILLDHHELMSTDVVASEQELARVTCERLGAVPGLQMLIGGYGMGFTLRAALAALGQDAEVTVAEIVPKIVEWARGPMRDFTAGCLDDPRVQLVEEDVGMLIAAARGGYDAILLDVDNGPEGLTRRVNDWLYSASGLEAARTALRPGGILAIWSATPDDRFTGLLARSGFEVNVVAVEAREGVQGNEEAWKHALILARKAVTNGG